MALPDQARAGRRRDRRPVRSVGGRVTDRTRRTLRHGLSAGRGTARYGVPCRWLRAVAHDLDRTCRRKGAIAARAPARLRLWWARAARYLRPYHPGAAARLWRSDPLSSGDLRSEEHTSELQ